MPSHSARRPSSSRRLWLILALLVLVALPAGAWLTFRAMQVKGSLGAARDSLTSAVDGLSGGDVGALRAAQGTASVNVDSARGAVDDPLWRLAAAVPVAGRSFAVTREATLVVEQVVDGVLPPLLDGATGLQDGALLKDGRIDLGLLGVLSTGVTQAESAAATAQANARAMPAGWVPAQLADARRGLVDQVDQVAGVLVTARSSLDVAPAMLGADGPRRYFLAVQNNAETRGPGGLVGAYAVLIADRGALSLERAGTNRDFKTAAAPVVDLGPDYAAYYDTYGARTLWSSAVLTPDWPSAAATMAGLWKAQGGGVVDGVLGVDPLAMRELLGVTGPAQVAGLTIGADNVVDFVMRDEYELFEALEKQDNAERKDVLAELATALYTEVAAGGYSSTDMVRALGRAGGSGNLQLWQSRPDEQAVIQPLRVAGALPGTPGAYLQVVSNNSAGNKADYYVRRKVTYERTAPGFATTTVELTNSVVASELPKVVTLRADKPPFPVEPGQTAQLLSVYVGLGQQISRVTVDGVEVPAQMHTERGHEATSVRVEIRTSRPTVVTVEASDPGGPLTYRQQPLVVDDELDLRVPLADH